MGSNKVVVSSCSSPPSSSSVMSLCTSCRTFYASTNDMCSTCYRKSVKESLSSDAGAAESCVGNPHVCASFTSPFLAEVPAVFVPPPILSPSPVVSAPPAGPSAAAPEPSSVSSSAEAAPSHPTAAPKAPLKNRCNACRVKLSLAATFTCRCELVFCGKVRWVLLAASPSLSVPSWILFSLII